MIVKKFLHFFTFIAIISTLVQGKIYKRCDFIKELVEKHNFNDEDAAKVACVAEASFFDTHRIVYHEERLENELNDRYLNLESASFKPNYGIFQISSEFWCSETGVGGICNVNCNDFLDDDITDDVECFKKIAPNLTDSDFGYDWKEPWNFRLDHRCLGSYLQPSTRPHCKKNPEEEVPDWNSLDDCLTNFPSFQYYELVPAYAGVPVKFHHEFPHSAAIGWSDPESDTIDWKCGGSLISEDTILTAAHCLKFKDVGLPNIVRLGDLNLKTDTDEKGAQQFEDFTVEIHPQYTKKFNDIALIKLKTKVEVSKFVTPACLWTRHDLPHEVDLEACGFGQTKHHGGYSPALMKVSLSAISMEECDEHYYGTDRYLKEGLSERAHLCAGDKSGIGMDTCQGDSGGPLEMKLHYGNKLVPFIVGVTSFGENCGAKKPGVYARISSYIDWIKLHVPDLELNAIECSKKHEGLRYKTYSPFQREFEPEKLVFGDQAEQKTTATIISDQFLITTASNLEKISNPRKVHFPSNSSDILIEKIVYHPKYKQGSSENDLALIKLKSGIRWQYKDHPACVSKKDTDFSEGFFYQSERLNGWNDMFREGININSKISDCLARNETKADLNTKTFTCFKTDSSYHVPNYCNVPVGSVILFDTRWKHKSVIKGLVIQSHES